MQLQSLKSLRLAIREEMYLQEKNMTLNLELRATVTRNVAYYHLHHQNYAATKFEVARSNRVKEEMHLQVNTLFDV